MNPFPEFRLGVGLKQESSRWVEPTGTPGDEARYLGSPFTVRQLGLAALVIATGLAILAGRAVQLQLFDGEHYRALAEGNRLRTTVLLAPRGIVFDRFGRPLTENIPRMSLGLVPFDVPRDPGAQAELFQRLASVSGFSIDDITRRWEELSADRQGSLEPLLLKNNIPLEEGLNVRVATLDWPGVVVLTTPRRFYPSLTPTSQSLGHVVGYVASVSEEEAASSDYAAEDVVGRSGIERTYDALLRGRNGGRQVEVDALGRELTVYAEEPAEAGENIWLTIDADLQAAAEAALTRALERAQVTRGAVVVLEPRTGDVLALVSVPAFDANAFTFGISSEAYQTLAANPDRPLFNRVVQGRYPSGSTIKPIIAAAALDEGIVAPTTTVLSTGGIAVGRWFFPDWKAGGHGLTDVRKALAESVNTFFYMVGGGYGERQGLGMERIDSHARRFGLGAVLGIDLPHEAAGLIPTPAWKQEVKQEPWYIGDTYHAAIGQGDVLVTPLQIASATAALANGGTLYRPRVRFLDPESGGRPGVVIEPAVAKPDSVAVVRDGMRDAVTAGSARFLNDLAIRPAGKTGTAELGGDHRPHAWFTGFAPYDAPELVVTVLVEEAGEGSTFAVPVAKEIFSWWESNRSGP